MNVFSVPKYLEQNEDKWLLPENPFNPVILCDGASESYNSSHWAEILVHSLRDSEGFHDAWLAEQIARYEKDIEPEKLSWSRQMAYERGSFSTLLSLQLKNGHWLVNAVGDTVAFSLNSHEVVDTYPYDQEDLFLNHPVLLSTKKTLNPKLSADYIDSPYSAELKTGNATHILLLTDALAHWLMKRRDDQRSLQRLLAIETQDQFTDFVMRERKKDLRLDDTTMIAINLEEQKRKMNTALPAVREE